MPKTTLAHRIVALALAAGVTAPVHAQHAKVITVPGFADFLAIDGRTVWATNKGRVEQWSRHAKKASVAMAHPCGGMAILDRSLWVADCKAGTLNRIDTRTAKIIATIATGIASPDGEMNVVAGAGSVRSSAGT
jgi:hypothetical protein